jgi:hypothetical protein
VDAEEEIVHAVAYLQSLKGDPPGQPDKVTDDKQWDPSTRDIVRPAYGDALDVTANPGLALAESVAVPLWSKAGPKGQSCAGCHGALGNAGGPAHARHDQVDGRGGGRYPKWYPQHRRMMSIEDFLCGACARRRPATRCRARARPTCRCRSWSRCSRTTCRTSST